MVNVCYFSFSFYFRLINLVVILRNIATNVASPTGVRLVISSISINHQEICSPSLTILKNVFLIFDVLIAQPFGSRIQSRYLRCRKDL